MAEQLPGGEEQEGINALAQSVLLHPYAVQHLMSRCAQEGRVMAPACLSSVANLTPQL